MDTFVVLGADTPSARHGCPAPCVLKLLYKKEEKRPQTSSGIPSSQVWVRQRLEGATARTVLSPWQVLEFGNRCLTNTLSHLKAGRTGVKWSLWDNFAKTSPEGWLPARVR
jgi:hypothetical protein